MKKYRSLENSIRDIMFNEKTLKPDNVIDPGQEKHPLDDPRFQSLPPEQVSDPKDGTQSNRSVNRLNKYLIDRSKSAQTKFKITDGD